MTYDHEALTRALAFVLAHDGGSNAGALALAALAEIERQQRAAAPPDVAGLAESLTTFAAGMRETYAGASFSLLDKAAAALTALARERDAARHNAAAAVGLHEAAEKRAEAAEARVAVMEAALGELRGGTDSIDDAKAIIDAALSPPAPGDGT